MRPKPASENYSAVQISGAGFSGTVFFTSPHPVVHLAKHLLPDLILSIFSAKAKGTRASELYRIFLGKLDYHPEIVVGFIRTFTIGCQQKSTGPRMKIIKWRDSYNTGIEQFDLEHHKIVDLIDTIFTAIRDKKGRDVMAKVCADILAYTDFHFAGEEAAMQAAEYPELEAHRNEHIRLKTEAQRYQAIIEKNFPDGVNELYRFLRDWFLHHIQTSDKRYVPYLQKKESGE
jgi:hemerythrin